MNSLNHWIALDVTAPTAATEAVYVRFDGAVFARRRVRAASWSSIWHLRSVFAVISYPKNPLYKLLAASGSWLGAFCAVSSLNRTDLPTSLSPQRVGKPQLRSAEPLPPQDDR
jgi:hypothetical protein